MVGEEEEFVCPNCNAPVDPDWKACPSCGIEFAGAEDEAAPPAPAPPAAPPPPKAAAAPPPKPPAAPSAARPPAATPPARPAPPPAARAPPARAAPPPKAARPAKGGSPLAGLRRRFGLVGILGLPVAVAGLVGFVVMMNYDTLIAGQAVNSIGEKQTPVVFGTVAVAGVGVFLTIFGMIKARTPSAREATELAEAEPAPVAAPVSYVPPPVRAQVPEPAYEAPSLYEEPAAPAYAPAASAYAPAAAEAEEGEEEDAFELPASPATAAAHVAAASAPAPPPSAPAAAPAVRDELEDLFGELESEVAKAEEDEVHYECPNCHGIVREDDTTCPHCNVTFEG